VKVSAPLITLGLQACQAVDAVLESAPALLVGTEGEGGNCFRKMQLRMSAPAAAMSLGIMRGCLREALDYAGQRWQGGRTIAEWPVVRMKLAEIAIQIDVAASCLSGILSAQGGAQAGESQAALAAAIHITDMACAATSEGVQILGGNGYMKDYGQEKRMRDARQTKSLLGMSGVKKLNYIERIITEGTI
jgi:alkylation response protein AidB-like acyl-CoA dehydrogenase